MTTPNGFFQDDRDSAYILISDLDIESQLFAISGILSRNESAEAAATQRIQELEEWAKKTNGIENQHAVDEWVDELHYSVYTDAAASMSAIGMFAPLLESIFTQAFSSLGVFYLRSGTSLPSHKRWTRPNTDNLDRWSAQTYFGSNEPRSDLFLGISQLSDATGLCDHLEKSDLDLLEALFFYRNRMFHMGFEWPMESRIAFLSHVEKKGWDDYFSSSTSGGEPWIIYLSTPTIRLLTAFIDGIISKIGRFARTLPHDLIVDPAISSHIAGIYPTDLE